jgi:hypothetical protein
MDSIECLKTPDKRKASFILGTFEDLADDLGTEQKNSFWNDAVFLRSRDKQLYVSGPNPRSVLFSVYAYLEKLGCRWLYPGPEGDYTPKATIRLDGFDLYERASSMIRGAAAYPDIEGAASYIDWMAKSRLNYFFSEYFLEARPGGRYGNPPMSEHELRVASWKRGMLDAAKLRGMIIERYGHGWSRGLVRRYAAETGKTETEAYQILRARRKGEKDDLKAKDVQHQEFCLSHPDVRRILIDDICRFLDEHADEQDVAGVWMGDGWDLACQCERCRTRPFSAWYMDIIREVATHVKKSAPRLYIECLVYMTTLPSPGGRPLQGLDNIIMMLGPMGRCYRHTLFDDSCRHSDWKPDFRNNQSLDLAHFHHPLNGDYMDAVREWQKCVDAPWYIFDYFNWFQTSWSKSFLGYLPQTLADEAATLHKNGFDGMVPCHYTQSFFPTNLILWTQARVLWNRRANPKSLRRQYLAAHFGSLADVAERHMDAMLDALLKCKPHRTPLWQEKTSSLRQIANELALLRDRFDSAFRHDGLDDTLHKRILLLKIDSVLQAGIYRAFYEHAAGNDARVKEISDELLTFLDAHQKALEGSLHFKFARWVVKWLPDKIKDKTKWVM